MQTAFRSEEEFTQAEFADWLERLPSSDINHYELLGGRIVMTPPASYPHGAIGPRISGYLLPHAGSGIVNDASAGFELPRGETVEPDVSFISADTLAAGPKPIFGKFYRLVPDLAVEILSPTTTRRDRIEKRDIYEANGVREYWLVDPVARALTVYRRDGDRFAAPIVLRDGHLTTDTMPGLTLPIAELFAGLD